jgi:hypothetical protein
MAINHADCDHPRTPAGRAACRAGRIDRAQPWGDPVVRTGGGKGVQIDVQPRAGRAPRPVPVQHDVAAGTVVDGEMNLPRDMPTMLANVARLAWDREDWYAMIGARYNDAEKRVVVTTPHGELSLVWKADSVANVWGVFWRATDSSVTKRIDTVNAGLRLANGQDA